MRILLCALFLVACGLDGPDPGVPPDDDDDVSADDDDDLIVEDDDDDDDVIVVDDDDVTGDDDDVTDDDDATDDDDDDGFLCHNDADLDGHYALECGGDDCDEADASVFGGRSESCDYVDNDCDLEVNEDIECWFYAHTQDELFRVDPFAGTAELVGDIPDMHDFDTHPDGTLYGIGPGLDGSIVYRLNLVLAEWEEVAETEASGNGFAIDNFGGAYMTADNSVYSVDLATGDSEWLGDLGGVLESSGDCVINKDDSLYMTSKHTEDGDTLVYVDRLTYQGTEIGMTGYHGVFGLTAAWGYMFGLTVAGNLIRIDPEDGSATLVETFTGRRWYGAASTPSR